MSLRRNFLRLPPLLRVARILGLLLPLAAMALLASALIAAWQSFPQLPAGFNRVLGIGINLSTLGGAMSVILSRYRLRFRGPDQTERRAYQLNSWQSQARAMAFFGALPLCGAVLALVIPPVVPALFLVIGITILAPIVLLLANANERTSGWAANRGGMRPSQRR